MPTLQNIEDGLRLSEYGRSTQVQQTHAQLDVVAASDRVLDWPAKATLRREDCLPAGKDPSLLNLVAELAGTDLVRAVVVSTDDKARCQVSTAGAGLGKVKRPT